jgi:hypothetical protein
VIKSADEFYKLRTSENIEEYTRAATEEAPIEVWREIIEKYPEMKTWVIHNKTVPEEILKFLADDSDSSVRSRVADKRKCPKDILLKLAKDEKSSVRARVAFNSKATQEVLEILACDSCEDVAEAAKSRLNQLKKT